MDYDVFVKTVKGQEKGERGMDARGPSFEK